MQTIKIAFYVLMKTVFTCNAYKCCKDCDGIVSNKLPPKLILVKLPPIPSKAAAEMLLILFPNIDSLSNDMSPLKAPCSIFSIKLKFKFRDISVERGSSPLLGTCSPNLTLNQIN